MPSRLKKKINALKCSELIEKSHRKSISAAIKSWMKSTRYEAIDAQRIESIAIEWHCIPLFCPIDCGRRKKNGELKYYYLLQTNILIYTCTFDDCFKIPLRNVCAANKGGTKA